MNKTRLFALACFMSVVPLTYIAKVSAGAVFKTVDEQGNVTFTDNPPAGSESREIKIRPINTQVSTAPAPPADADTAPTGETAEKKPEEEVKEVRYSASFITQPLDQSTVPPGQTEVVVQIGLKPPLQEGHVVKLLHNGEVGSPTTSTRFTLTNLIRGEHQIRAQIFGADGNRKAETQTITFYVKRYHPKKSKN
jgi:hypothetical protein